MHLRLGGNRSPRSCWRARGIALALAALGTVSAACGDSPSASVANLASPSTAAPSTTTAASGSPAGGGGNPSGSSGSSTIGLGGVTVQLAQCMRSHGVANFPDPNSQGQVQMSGVNPQSPSFEAAQRACAKYSPNGGKPPSAAQQQAAIASALKFSKCMRSHGIADFPDPQVSSSGGGVSIAIRIHGGQGSDLDPRNSEFQAAQRACQSLVPFGRGQTVAGRKS